MINLFNENFRKGFKEYPDNYFDLLIADPPFGIGETWRKSKRDRFYKHKSDYTNDKIPTKADFKEMFRVSKNQIIFGYNYFTRQLGSTNNLIVWDKDRDSRNTFFSEIELAWTSLNRPALIYSIQWNGAKKGIETGIKKIHPFQKPVLLYKYILRDFAKPGFKIVDPYMGSGSSAIACIDMGYEFFGWEKDSFYFKETEIRVNNHQKQIEAFSPAVHQDNLFKEV